MGRPSLVPDVIETEVTANPIEMDITAKQAEELKLIDAKKDRVKKPRSEKQIEATKILIEKNKAWREKLKAEKESGKSDNHIQSLLADKVDDGAAEQQQQQEEKPKSTRIRFRIKKATVHPRPNHHLKRKAQSQAEESDVGNTTATETEDTDAIVDELRARAQRPSYPSKKFVSMR